MIRETSQYTRSPGEVAASTADPEPQDADKVNRAMGAMEAGRLEEAEELLLSVIANCPAAYTNSSEMPRGTLRFKFWDMEEFTHFVLWQKAHGIKRAVVWLKNAYPRAHYCLGYLYARQAQYARALEYLERGCKLEPTNPKFALEIGAVLFHGGRKAEALAWYQSVKEIGPHVNAAQLAAARRGCGGTLLELGRLDEAEAAFRSSVKIGPDDPNALEELEYINQLRKGGNISPFDLRGMHSPDLFQCVFCGDRFADGVVVQVGGVLESVCKECERKLTMKP